MDVKTTRFGKVQIEPGDVLSFPEGLIGMERVREWVLLADAENSALGWLQSTSRPEVALPVVSPRRFVPRYQVRVFRSELGALEVADVRSVGVLVIVSHDGTWLTVNLKAPVLVNLRNHLGRQVVTGDDQPVQYQLTGGIAPLRKSA
jgi:flagellar assembly factor FliW